MRKIIILKLTSLTVHKTEGICICPHGVPQPCHIGVYFKTHALKFNSLKEMVLL
jgi:hypothetical protein